MEPQGLEKIMSVAELVDDWSGEGDSSEKREGSDSKMGWASNGRFQAQSVRGNGQGGNRQGGGLNRPKPNTPTTTSPNNGSHNPHNRLKPPFRHLTPEEVAKWKAEGLCFRCDEKYRYNHRCAKPELLVLMLLEDGTEIDISDCSVELAEATWKKKGR